LVEQHANVAFLFLSYFDYVMLTCERYQALHAIHIHVPGEPGNEAILLQLCVLAYGSCCVLTARNPCGLVYGTCGLSSSSVNCKYSHTIELR